MRRTWLIDSGHGGMIDGVYQTAPKKMYTHESGVIAYEGIINRQIKQRLLELLKTRGVHYIDLCPTELDVELDERVDIANVYHREYKNCVLISLHSNAGKGTGFEIWTSVGQTQSDKHASMLGHELENAFPDIKFRKDMADGDLDKESQFYILKYTKCPAILPECLFFDNYSDFRKLISPVFQQRYVLAIANFILRAETTIQ